MLLIEVIIPSLTSLAGVVIGWGLNEISKRISKKPRLVFRMVATPEAELSEESVRTKTSESEFGIEIFNIGAEPVVIDGFSLIYPDEDLTDCILPDNDERVILPYKSYVYTLDQQEYDAMLYHCKRKIFKQCRIFATMIDGKTVVKGRLDTIDIYLRASSQMNDDIIE